MAKTPLIARRVGFQNALLAWYRVHQRVLPWRTAPSLYKTVVSEFMLQQTQVKTVLPYFARWLVAFPDFQALAAAPEDAVLKGWEGLGYYSRARNLHRLAQAVAAMPAPPRSPEAWRELPGIGPYTSAAITSISFGEPAAVVDGNVVRILTRLSADGTPFRDSASAAKALTPLADAMLNTASPGDHNQAMMELGATVCHRQSPLCTVCPVLTFCAAAQRGEPESFPKLAPKLIEQRAVTRLWCFHEGKLLLHRAASSSRRLAGQHELPTAAQLGFAETAPAKESDSAAATASESFGPATLLTTKRRGITRYAITESIHRLDAAHVPSPLPEGLVWASADELARITLSGPHRRWVAELSAKHG